MKSQITTPHWLRLEGRGGTREEEMKRARTWRGGVRKRWKDAEITESKIEKRRQGEQNKGGPITFANSTRQALACIALPLGKSSA